MTLILAAVLCFAMGRVVT